MAPIVIVPISSRLAFELLSIEGAALLFLVLDGRMLAAREVRLPPSQDGALGSDKERRSLVEATHEIAKVAARLLCAEPCGARSHAVVR